jgi:hypothetical protein
MITHAARFLVRITYLFLKFRTSQKLNIVENENRQLLLLLDSFGMFILISAESLHETYV